MGTLDNWPRMPYIIWVWRLQVLFTSSWNWHWLAAQQPLPKKPALASFQCCGSMTFWGGSGSADPCLWLVDPDSDPGSGFFYFCHWPSRCQQKTNFFANDILKLHLHHFSKIKIQKESQNSRNQGFSYYFSMIIEGSGSWRPKNMWIRIRIRNTASFHHKTNHAPLPLSSC